MWWRKTRLPFQWISSSRILEVDSVLSPLTTKEAARAPVELTIGICSPGTKKSKGRSFLDRTAFLKGISIALVVHQESYCNDVLHNSTDLWDVLLGHVFCLPRSTARNLIGLMAACFLFWMCCSSTKRWKVKDSWQISQDEVNGHHHLRLVLLLRNLSWTFFC